MPLIYILPFLITFSSRLFSPCPAESIILINHLITSAVSPSHSPPPPTSADLPQAPAILRDPHPTSHLCKADWAAQGHKSPIRIHRPRHARISSRRRKGPGNSIHRCGTLASPTSSRAFFLPGCENSRPLPRISSLNLAVSPSHFFTRRGRCQSLITPTSIHPPTHIFPPLTPRSGTVGFPRHHHRRILNHGILHCPCITLLRSSAFTDDRPSVAIASLQRPLLHIHTAHQ